MSEHTTHDVRTVVIAGHPGRIRCCFTCRDQRGTALTLTVLPF